jgi:hypothetical protein
MNHRGTEFTERFTEFFKLAQATLVRGEFSEGTVRPLSEDFVPLCALRDSVVS